MKNVEGIRVRWADAEPSQRYETSIDGGPWQPTTLRVVQKDSLARAGYLCGASVMYRPKNERCLAELLVFICAARAWKKMRNAFTVDIRTDAKCDYEMPKIQRGLLLTKG